MHRLTRTCRLLGSLLGSTLTALGTTGMRALKHPGLRRPLLAMVALTASACHNVKTARSVLLNDVHSRLNPTTVIEVHAPQSVAELVSHIRTAKLERQAVSLSGSASLDDGRILSVRCVG